MANSWDEYQEEAADFFRSLGLAADTNVTVKGVRTKHDIDVFVTSQHVGFNVTWLVECKFWQVKVSKMHVLALREIVTDVGADRGILLCEVGFQSGAIEAANLTNVKLTSLADCQVTASNQIVSMQLMDLYDRNENCRERYWETPKEIRVECGVRPDSGACGYSGDSVIILVNELLSRAMRGVYPFASDSIQAIVLKVEQQFNSAQEILPVVERLVVELEAKLDACDKYRRDAK